MLETMTDTWPGRREFNQLTKLPPWSLARLESDKLLYLLQKCNLTVSLNIVWKFLKIQARQESPKRSNQFPRIAPSKIINVPIWWLTLDISLCVQCVKIGGKIISKKIVLHITFYLLKCCFMNLIWIYLQAEVKLKDLMNFRYMFLC